MSNVKEFIPESVKNTWHNWSVSLKKAKSQVTGAEETDDEHADHSSQDVHEAGKKSKASQYSPLFSHIRQAKGTVWISDGE